MSGLSGYSSPDFLHGLDRMDQVKEFSDDFRTVVELDCKDEPKAGSRIVPTYEPSNPQPLEVFHWKALGRKEETLLPQIR